MLLKLAVLYMRVKLHVKDVLAQAYCIVERERGAKKSKESKEFEERNRAGRLASFNRRAALGIARHQRKIS